MRKAHIYIILGLILVAAGIFSIIQIGGDAVGNAISMGLLGSGGAFLFAPWIRRGSDNTAD